MLKFALIILLALPQARAAYVVKQTLKDGKIKIESVDYLDKKITEKILLKDIREELAEEQKTAPVQYQEWMIPDQQISAEQETIYHAGSATPEIAGSEVREIVKQGPDHNRIIFTVLGDGYTGAEKEKYFADVERIVGDMFKEVTFKSYLPLFNIYAVFVPSKDSGITDIERKNTAFGLYRNPRGSKRGVMPGNRGAIDKALKLVDAYTDYPIIIGNDEFYGGLGGRYAITTRSIDSGSMVLRHELGHNFSNVGEEYDGGQVYSGANFSSSANVPWKHWLEGELEVHKAKFLTGSYVWQNLYKKDFEESFNFPASQNYFFSMKLSSVGWSYKDDVKVYLDGEQLELDGRYTVDRSFFNTKNVNLGPGEHKISVQDHSRDGDNVLAYVNGYAYPADYNFTYGLVGAFNVFDSSGRQRGYRPTHEQCLMRDMRSKVFCPVDQENIWLRFLNKVNIIDSVEVGEKVEVKTLPLKGLDYRWYKKSFWGKGDELTQFRGQGSIEANKLASGKYVVEAAFSTQEIRKETDKTTGSKEFEIK